MPTHRIVLSERHEFVESLSKVIGRMNGTAAQIYWRGVARRLIRLQLVCGADRMCAEQEAKALLHAVLRNVQERQLRPDE